MKFRNLFVASKPEVASARLRPTATRLAVETLETRFLPAALSISDVTVMEGTSGVSNAAVNVALSAPLKRPVTVSYDTSNGTATAGYSYAAVSGKLSFAKGETVKKILVPIYGDQNPEPNAYFFVRLWGNKGAALADSNGTVTIIDSSPRLSVSPQYSDEGNVMTFTVTLSAPLSTTLTVDFSTEDGSPEPGHPSAAYAGLDYVATSGTLTFAPGETTKTFTVHILADNEEEYDEYFYVNLQNASSPCFIENGYGYIYGEYGPL